MMIKTPATRLRHVETICRARKCFELRQVWLEIVPVVNEAPAYSSGPHDAALSVFRNERVAPLVVNKLILPAYSEKPVAKIGVNEVCCAVGSHPPVPSRPHGYFVRRKDPAHIA